MNNLIKIAVALLALTAIFAVKPYYGREVAIRLNEPTDFNYSPSSYSNLIFYSLIYENLFYLDANGDIQTHIFKEYRYDKQTRTLNLRLKENIYFSDGTAIRPRHVEISLKLYLGINLASSRKLRRTVKAIRIPDGSGDISVELMVDDANIIASLTVPELVLMGGSDQSFSGGFYPVEWVKNRYIKLNPNPFYAGGRSYLDSLKVVFYDYYYPDVFLSEPGMTNKQFNELNAGVYQNIYLVFPKGKVGANTRVALYSLLKGFYRTQGSGLSDLNALTANDESPVTLNIPTFSNRRQRSILRYSRIKLFILSSLNKIEQPFNEFLGKKRLSIEPIYLSDNQLGDFVKNNSVEYLLMAKTFNRRTPIEEKLTIILKELSFNRFNETYLQLLNQLDEVKYLENEELLLDLSSKIIEKIINDGFILPLYQRRYSIYVKKSLQGIQLDYYGKPLFQKVRLKQVKQKQVIK
ncbi:MAG: hypothetical protein GY940_06450 [bacterium]|nr:hypothetical protein [bacterium]